MRCVNIKNNANLRIVRQAIHDINMILKYINEDYKNSKFMKGFIASFIITYLLYQDEEYGEIIRDYPSNYFLGLSNNNDKQLKISSLRSRCIPISSILGVEILDRDKINMIVRYMNGENTLIEYLNEKLLNEQKIPSIFDSLALYMTLEDEDFSKHCISLENMLINQEFNNPNDLGQAIDVLTHFDLINRVFS